MDHHFPSDFEQHDFIDDPNFDQFINLIRGENEESVVGFDYDLLNGCSFVDNGFGQFDATSAMLTDPKSIYNAAVSSFDGEIMKGGEEDEENSSGSTTTATGTGTGPGTKKAKVDRSRTLISERRRRGRMKEKLYALRSLVPNITKMDKASIIGDAVLYVQDLQMQAKRLKAEIAGLQASLAESEMYQESMDDPVRVRVRVRVARTDHPIICRKIFQLDMFQVEQGEFYVRVVCNKGEGVAVSLCKALESLSNFRVRNSIITSVSERFALTSTLNVTDFDQSINLPNVRLWVSGALLNQGFEFIAPSSS